MTPPTRLVTSGKGGVGTPVIAAVGALVAAQRTRVLLVEASESGGTRRLTQVSARFDLLSTLTVPLSSSLRRWS